MLSMFTGTPGSYKSYHATEQAIKDLKQGYNVIANFPIDYKRLGIKPRGEFVFLRNSDFKVEYFLNYAKEHHKNSYHTQTIVYIDEAAVIFNARRFNDKDRLDWINFFANHRHFNYNFVLITQMDMMIDKQIRFLVETEIRHRALTQYKLLGLLAGKFLKMYLEVEMWYPCKMKTRSQFRIFKKKYADCYDTMALFIDDKNDNSTSNIDKKSKKKEVEKHETTSGTQKSVSSRIRFKKSDDDNNSNNIDTVTNADDNSNAVSCESRSCCS